MHSVDFAARQSCSDHRSSREPGRLEERNPDRKCKKMGLWNNCSFIHSIHCVLHNYYVFLKSGPRKYNGKEKKTRKYGRRVWITHAKKGQYFCKNMLHGRNKCGKSILQKPSNSEKTLQNGRNLAKVHIILMKFCEIFC